MVLSPYIQYFKKRSFIPTYAFIVQWVVYKARVVWNQSLNFHFTHAPYHSSYVQNICWKLVSTEYSSLSNLSVTSPTSQLILQPFRRFTYVTAHSPTLPLLHLRHCFSNPSFASPTSQALHLIHLASRCWSAPGVEPYSLPPEYESRALPRSHLARWLYTEFAYILILNDSPVLWIGR